MSDHLCSVDRMNNTDTVPTTRSDAVAHDRTLYQLMQNTQRAFSRYAFERERALYWAASTIYVSSRGTGGLPTEFPGCSGTPIPWRDFPTGTLFWQAKTFQRGEGEKAYVKTDDGRRIATLDDLYERRDDFADNVNEQIDKVEPARLAYVDAAAKIEPHEANYTGWTRYFLVTSSAGHVHNGTGCSTCRPSTTFSPVFTLSAATADEAIDELGATLCSVCYPDAPVESTGGKITKAAAKKLATALAS